MSMRAEHGFRRIAMNDYKIYALKGDPEWSDLVFSSFQKGEGRFGWSYIETADLRKLQKRIDKDGWESLSEDEKACYQPFLLDFQPGDYVVYINIFSVCN
jgi:hypothetical protein